MLYIIKRNLGFYDSTKEQSQKRKRITYMDIVPYFSFLFAFF